ncbi:hypothetical protein [Leucobacter salsicius]|uniref:hypothetical protein n=1 Tax=Leucobacter salsicius TaxID=664638 RepID=UPI00034AD01B|nr:hypothetical protein [Leucobacter salsicius]
MTAQPIQKFNLPELLQLLALEYAALDVVDAEGVDIKPGNSALREILRHPSLHGSVVAAVVTRESVEVAVDDGGASLTDLLVLSREQGGPAGLLALLSE